MVIPPAAMTAVRARDPVLGATVNERLNAGSPAACFGFVSQGAVAAAVEGAGAVPASLTAAGPPAWAAVTRSTNQRRPYITSYVPGESATTRSTAPSPSKSAAAAM